LEKAKPQGARCVEYGGHGTTVTQLLAINSRTEKSKVSKSTTGGKHNFWCTNSQAVLATHLPEDITEHMHKNVGSKYATVECSPLIHAKFCTFCW
jgi:hypothetical protein